MATLAYCGVGLFVVELRRNRQMYIAHLTQIEKQQALRREAEEQLRVLAESSPAAIMTMRTGMYWLPTEPLWRCSDSKDQA
jgi:two-component system, LuxR family, sensor kinase FixL